jgi:hypothetical protein
VTEDTSPPDEQDPDFTEEGTAVPDPEETDGDAEDVPEAD